jgi:CRP/FNR family transcriptional regulator, cyclic AMP receptor protein
MMQPEARVDRPLPLEIAIPPGRVVVRQGEPCGQLRVLTRGAMLMTAVEPDGRTLALDVLGPGDPVGDRPGAVSMAEFRALGPCRLRQAPESALAQMHLVGRRLDRLTLLARELAWLGVTDRVDHRLVDLANRFGRPGPGGTSVALRLTQDDLAALCGTSRESANRALRSLRDRGRVRLLGRGRYLVRDQTPDSHQPPPGDQPARDQGLGSGSASFDAPVADPSWRSTRLQVLQ